MPIVGLMLLGFLQNFTPLPTIEVKTASDVALVKSVNDAISALSQTVTACVDRGGKPETCRCSDPSDLAALRKRYAAMIAQRPEWKDQLLSYQYMNKEGRNVSGTLVAANVRRQIEALKCE